MNSVHWKNITFQARQPFEIFMHLFTYSIVQIFDVPSRGEDTFEDRYKFLQESFGENGTLKASQIVVVQHEQATSRDHVLEKLKEIESLGGEGLMLRKHGSYVLVHPRYYLLTHSLFFVCQDLRRKTVWNSLKNQGMSYLHTPIPLLTLFRSRPSMMQRLSLQVTLRVKDVTRAPQAL